MDLIEKIKKIAEAEGISESKLILREALWFFEEHRTHGAYQIIIEKNRDKVSSIKLYCTAGGLIYTNICSHQRIDDEKESWPSVIYSSQVTGEMRYQKRRRS